MTEAARWSLTEELNHGISLGLSPIPEGADVDGETVTGLSSWWNHLHCLRCGHTFRRGDRVRVDSSRRRVEHLIPGLGCAGPADADADVAEIAAFRDGLLSAWPVAAEIRLHRIADDDWRLPQGRGDERNANVCLHCGHTFRPGEYVVLCPCRPALPTEDGARRPAACGRAVHRDPAAGLSCWESWRPDGTVPVCPVTQATVNGQ